MGRVAILDLDVGIRYSKSRHEEGWNVNGPTYAIQPVYFRKRVFTLHGTDTSDVRYVGVPLGARHVL